MGRPRSDLLFSPSSFERDSARPERRGALPRPIGSVQRPQLPFAMPRYLIIDNFPPSGRLKLAHRCSAKGLIFHARDEPPMWYRSCEVAPPKTSPTERRRNSCTSVLDEVWQLLSGLSGSLELLRTAALRDPTRRLSRPRARPPAPTTAGGRWWSTPTVS